MIRAFVAIPVPGPVTGTLSAAQAGLEVGRLVAEENFHITLAFLGEHRTRVVEDVADALSGIGGAAFDVTLAGLGTFGTPPRTLFAEIAATAPLSDLRKRVRRAVAEGGVALAHERFRPHVTLARFGQGVVGEDAERLHAHIARRMGFVQGTVPVRSFTLFESYLGRAGPIYTPLVEYPLSV